MSTLRYNERSWAKHTGALQWIERFEHSANNTNRPLPEVLVRTGCKWYEMKPDSMADLVAGINYGERLFIAKLDKPSFVNQRLVSFIKTTPELDTDLIHALLNSILGLFFIEALGFGRALGALDLSTTRLREGLKILNPNLLQPKQVEQIKHAFHPISVRNVLPLLDELKSGDRRDFDEIVLNCFGIAEYWEQIETSLSWLHRRRCSP